MPTTTLDEVALPWDGASPTWEGWEPEPASFRAVPLLRVTAEHVFLGLVHVVVTARGDLRARMVVEQEHWVRSADGHCTPATADWEPLAAWDGVTPPRDGAPEERAASFVKALAERSRNEVVALRAVRSTLEAGLGRTLRDDAAGSDPQHLLASLIELARIANRAGELCREAVREGFWVWRRPAGDRGYRIYRRLVDPSLERTDPLDPAEDPVPPPWLRAHDRGIRQLRAAEEQLANEADQVYGLLDGASTVAATRDASSQEQLTILAALAAVALGIPGLVFALYGADVLVPFSEGGRQLSVLAITFVATAALPVAAQLRIRTTTIGVPRKVLNAIAIAAVLTALLYLVGSFDPGAAPVHLDCLPASGGALSCDGR